MSKRALFSLHRLDKVEDFARALIGAGWEIVASRETVERLAAQQIPVTDIGRFVGIAEGFPFPPTLHPKIELALTGDGEPRIDLVYVIPYPRSVGNDVGGRTLLALAAKGGRIPVMDIQDMDEVVAQISKIGDLEPGFRRQLQDKANKMIARHFASLVSENDPSAALFYEDGYRLMNGENPYQVPADLLAAPETDTLGIPLFLRVSGEPPCFTNVADADSILDALCRLSDGFRKRFAKTPFLCIAAKHGNACGAAYNWNDPLRAIEEALFGNARAVWGGELIVNFEIGGGAAEGLFQSKQRKETMGNANWMLDVVMAPRFSQEAVAVLGQRSARKLLACEALFEPRLSEARWTYRTVRGGALRQPPANFVLDLEEARPLFSRANDETAGALLVAWAAAWSSSLGGNEVAIAKDSRLLSVGGGPSTVDAALSAVRRAHDCGHDLRGSCFAADAFFPFTDAPDVLVGEGVTHGLVPAGGKHQGEIEDFFRSKGVNVFFLPEPYRGFCRH